MKTERPKYDYKQMREYTAKKLLQEVLEWHAQWDEDEPVDEETILKELENCVGNDDGYEIARSLDQQYNWSPDTSLVEILDNSFFHMHDAQKMLIKKWVTENDIQPEFEVGQTVIFRHFTGEGGKVSKGTITRIEKDTAQYVINSKELGHVEEGQLGTTGIYCDYEDVSIS